jgi:hypothetical protein
VCFVDPSWRLGQKWPNFDNLPLVLVCGWEWCEVGVRYVL